MKNYSGFTLAEVLIALGVVGIVAAMTLPVLINDIQGRQLQSALKKSYSTISQALDMYYAENGERNFHLMSHDEFKSMLLKYIKNIRDCGYGYDGDSKACVKARNFANVYKTYNNKAGLRYASFDDGQFVMNDGTLVMVNYRSGNLKYITVDVNGYLKRPNKLGQDVFMFQLGANGKLLPMGMEETIYPANNTYCSITSEDQYNGAGCTYKALTEKDFFKNLPK